jgi:hypothetical protein
VGASASASSCFLSGTLGTIQTSTDAALRRGPSAVATQDVGRAAQTHGRKRRAYRRRRGCHRRRSPRPRFGPSTRGWGWPSCWSQSGQRLRQSSARLCARCRACENQGQKQSKGTTAVPIYMPASAATTMLVTRANGTELKVVKLRPTTHVSRTATVQSGMNWGVTRHYKPGGREGKRSPQLVEPQEEDEASGLHRLRHEPGRPAHTQVRKGMRGITTAHATE